MNPLVNDDLAHRIRNAVDPAISGEWPAERLQVLRDAGVFRWGMPAEFGGLPVSTPQMLDGYIELARLCLTTAFILTQRDAACHRIANSENQGLRQQLLPDHCTGRAMATVGISHLSTSRQHWSRPSVVATRTPAGFELTGEAPWVTGAGHVDLLVTGATLENGEQILVAIPARRDGVRVGLPLALLALNESRTGSVVLDRVAVTTDEVILGPTSQVMKVGQTGGTGSFTTTAVALGAARSTLDGLQSESQSRPDLLDLVTSLSQEHARLRSELLEAAGNPPRVSEGRTEAERLRFQANSLVVRAAHAYVCCTKGAAFVSGHPAERAWRESMFFQVWSCPPNVTRDTLLDLSGTTPRPTA